MAKKPEVLFVELCNMHDSGWIKDGTAGTPHEEHLRSPGMCWIPNTGFRKKKLPNGTYQHEELRYIRNSDTYVRREQEERGIKPNPSEDIIQIEKGYLTVEKTGNGTVLAGYLEDVSYNESNPERIVTATALYRTIKKDENSEKTIDREIAWLDAGSYIKTLQMKQGGQYRFKEEKIDALCSILNLFGETYAKRFELIIDAAKRNPEKFMQLVTKLEQTALTSISHALQLDVIRFNKNAVEYVGKEKIIKSLGAGNLDEATKIERLADYFLSEDGKDAYQEFNIELEMAQEKQLSAV